MRKYFNKKELTILSVGLFLWGILSQFSTAETIRFYFMQLPSFFQILLSGLVPMLIGTGWYYFLRREFKKDYIRPYLSDLCYEYDHIRSKGVLTGTIVLEYSKDFSKNWKVDSANIELVCKPHCAEYSVRVDNPKYDLDKAGNVFFNFKHYIEASSHITAITDYQKSPYMVMVKCVVRTNHGEFLATQDRIPISSGQVLDI